MCRCIRCRFPSSRRFSVGVCLGFHGLKSPRLFNFASSRRLWTMCLIKTYVLMFFCRKNIIRMPWKFFTKPYFRRNPAGKPEMPSWKNIISQQENYFFSVGKSFFSSRAFSDPLFEIFLFNLSHVSLCFCSNFLIRYNVRWGEKVWQKKGRAYILTRPW